MNKCVMIFSGGQDSTTCLIQALEQYDEVHTITFDYGQRHKLEVEIAREIATDLGVTSHKILDVSVLGELAISSLTSANIEISHELLEGGFPNTFVPGRNILFLTMAGIFAYQIGAKTLITGVCETDFSGYPDCRDDFIQAMAKALQLGMDYELELRTPLMFLNKSETWALADHYQKLQFVREHTLTCYNGVVGDGCGECPSCLLRHKGLKHYLENRSQILSTVQQKCDLI